MEYVDKLIYFSLMFITYGQGLEEIRCVPHSLAVKYAFVTARKKVRVYLPLV